MDNIVGKKFNKWTVIAEAPKKGYRSFVMCRCDCGTDKVVEKQSVTRGVSKSCGCNRTPVPSQLTHGCARDFGMTKEYRAWVSMRNRCYNKNNKRYDNYGGRGITVCDRWRDSFENFLADMGEATSKSHSLDRKENDGNYEPNNCRWATAKEQANNRRNNMFVTFNGQTKKMSEWSDLLGIPNNALHIRYKKTGTTNFNKPYKQRVKK